MPNAIDFGVLRVRRISRRTATYHTELQRLSRVFRVDVTAGGQIWVHFTQAIVISRILQIDLLFFALGTANEPGRQCQKVLNRTL